jgi:hypothetical protein
MVRQAYLSGRRLAAVFVSVAVASALLCFLALAATHVHDDLKCHKDCAVCLWQATFFSLLHSGIPLVYVAVVALLLLATLQLPLLTELIRQAPIRAPPYLQD